MLTMLALACLAVSACSSNPRSLIQGKWQQSEGGPTAEFKDGVATFVEEGGITLMRYEWVDDQTIDLGGEGKVKVTVTSQELTLTFPDARVEEFKRAR
jgi:hypothetical protein